MPIVYNIGGDIMKSQTRAFVNPINCKGVWGKGLALQMKEAYPEGYKGYLQEYKAYFRHGGDSRMYLMEDERWMICVATKEDWRDPSQLEWIEKSLQSIAEYVKIWDIPSLAITGLGTGNGKLSFADVMPLMVKYLEPLPCDVTIYIPHSAEPHMMFMKEGKPQLVHDRIDILPMKTAKRDIKNAIDFYGRENVYVVNVTSGAKTADGRPSRSREFSPFFHFGDIPVPFTPGECAASTEGVYQGLKFLLMEGTNSTHVLHASMENPDPSGRNGGRIKRKGDVLGHLPGLVADPSRVDLLNKLDTRLSIYLPVYFYQLEVHLKKHLAVIRQQHREGKAILLVDWETSDLYDLKGSLSHAQLIKRYLLDYEKLSALAEAAYAQWGFHPIEQALTIKR